MRIHRLAEGGQMLFSTDNLPTGETFSVRVWQPGQNTKLYHNCTHIYMSNNAYIIIRKDSEKPNSHITTHNMDKCTVEIN